MAKRRQRITPRIPKRPRKDYDFSSTSEPASSDSVDENKVESSSSSKVVKQSDFRSSGSPTKRRTTKTRRKDSEEIRRNSLQRIKDITVSKSAFAKWKPLSKSTKEYTKQVIANTYLNIVGEVSSDTQKDQVNQCLKNLQKRIILKVDALRGPDSKVNYKMLEEESKSVEETLSAVNTQLHTLETELDIQKKLLKEEEELLNKQNINLSVDTQSVQDKTSTSSLHLIKLSRESIQRPIPQIPSDLNKAAQKLANVLSKRKEDFEKKGLSKWLEALIQLHSQIENNSDN